MLNNEALNKAVQVYMEYPPRAEIRKLVTAIIEAYIKHANKHTEKPWQQEVQEGHDRWNKALDERRSQNPSNQIKRLKTDDPEILDFLNNIDKIRAKTSE